MWLFPAAVALAAFGQTAPTTELPKDPRAILALAAQRYDWNDPAVKPWHFKASYQLYDRTGQPSANGTVEYWWASPTVHRTTWIQGDDTLSEWHTADGKRLTVASGADIRYFVAEIPQELLDPLPGKIDPRNVKLERDMIRTGRVNFPCVRTLYRVKSAGFSGERWDPTSMYCFDRNTPALLLKGDHDGIEDQYGDFVAYQGRDFPRSLSETMGKRRLLTVAVEAIGEVNANDAAFRPPDEAKMDGLVYVRSPGSKIAGPSPHISAHDEAHGMVVFEAKIDPAGRVQELELIGGPGPSLDEALRTAASQWTYPPYVVNGKPVARRTLIEVYLAPFFLWPKQQMP